MKKFLLSALAVSASVMAFAGTGIQSDPYTVDDITGMEVPATPEVGVYVKGYIIGSIDNSGTDYGFNTNTFVSTPNSIKTNIVLAASSAEDDLAYMLPVKVPAGALRDEITVGGNPAVLGHEIIICGTWTKGWGVSTITDVTSYEWVGDAPSTPSAGDYATGSADKPLTVTELIAQGKPSVAVPNTFVTGYIVGYIPGMNYSEAVIGTEGEVSSSNILMAASADETNTANCIPVQLPAGDVRAALNLKDNAGNLGRQVTVFGSHEAYFGQNGMKGITAYAFDGGKIDVDVPVTPGTGDTGTAENPLTVDQYLALGIPAAAVANTYVKGAIVGYVPGMSFSDAVIGVSGEVSATNILIAASAAETDINKCIPVQLPAGAIRSDLNLLDNPGNLGKTVTLCGSREKYFGVAGLKSPKSYAWEGEEIPDYFYEALVSDANGWTVDNVIMPADLTYVWGEWNTQYNYIAGSAFKDNVAYAAEAYLISPVIDLSKRAKVVASFEHAAKFQTSLKDECGFVVREEGETTWTELTISEWPAAGAWTFVNSGDFDLSAYDGKKIQVAFKYGSTDQGADTWEVKNLRFAGTEPNSVASVELAEEGEPVYFNLQGVRVENPANGIFIKVVGKKASKVAIR